MTAELLDKATANLYGGISKELISATEVTDKTASIPIFFARKLLPVRECRCLSN